LAAAFKLSFDPSANMDTVDVPDEMPAGALPEGLIPSVVPSSPMRQQQQQQQQQQTSSSSLIGAAGVVAPGRLPRDRRKAGRS
jgi:hypothetical protein